MDVAFDGVPHPQRVNQALAEALDDAATGGRSQP
jgi:hypothetical protein